MPPYRTTRKNEAVRWVRADQQRGLNWCFLRVSGGFIRMQAPFGESLSRAPVEIVGPSPQLWRKL
jgi:hypothetical protein